MKTILKTFLLCILLQINSFSQNQNLCDSCCFKNFKQFFYSDGTAPWTIPMGVNKIMVEIWSGGGASNDKFGGGGGGYGKAILNVTPGEVIGVYVAGTGRPPGPGRPVAESGGDSKVTTAAQSVTVKGGGGAGPLPGFGGAYLTSTGNPMTIFIPGIIGEATKISYSQMTSAKYIKIINYGNGGNGGNTFNSGGAGGYRVRLTTGGADLENVEATRGMEGTGGGGGAQASGQYGGRGSIIIHY